MTDMPFDPSQAGDPTAPGAQAAGQPSEEEMRQYLAQMRSAPVEQVLAEVLQGLLNAAQVKLGRKDARLLLDTSSAVVDQTRPHLSSDLVGQVDQALSQLKMAQVEAEKEVAQAGANEANDLAAAGESGASAGSDQPDGSAGQAARPGQAPAGDSPVDKLWIPGR